MAKGNSVTANREQFQNMPIEEILRLPSIESITRGGRSVASLMPRVPWIAPSNYDQLRQSMRDHGQRYPVHIDRGFRLLTSYCDTDLTGYANGLDELLGNWLGNGHHRVAVALELGWTHMTCSRTLFDTDPEYERYRNQAPVPLTRVRWLG